MSRVFSIFLFIIVLILLAVLFEQYNSPKVTVNKQVDESADSVKSEGVIIRPEKQLLKKLEPEIPEQLMRNGFISKVALSVQATDESEKGGVITLVNFSVENGAEKGAQDEGSSVDTPVNAVSSAASAAIKQEQELHKRLIEKQRNWYAQAKKGLLKETIQAAANEADNVQNVYFRFGSASLTDEASSNLQRISRRLKSKPDIKIEIASYSGEENISGSENHRISQLRAEAVKDYFVSSGVEVSRLSTKAYESKNTGQNFDDSLPDKPKQADYLEIHEK